MRVLKFALIICILALHSCQGNVPISPPYKNDTIEILKASIKQGISGEFMPSASPLERKYHFGDSILLTSESLPLSMLPSKLDDQKFKILSREQICSIIEADKNTTELPNYICVSRFEKSDTGYYVQVQSLSCVPYGGGGSLGLYYKKIKDSFLVVDRSSSSIN